MTTRERDENMFGEPYSPGREAAEGAKEPSGTVDPRGAGTLHADGPDLPPDNGRRAGFDPKTGAVRGSGVGDGGGQEGEDFDDDPATGDGPPVPGRPAT